MLDEIKEFTVPEEIANKLENFVLRSGQIFYKFVNNTCEQNEIDNSFSIRGIENDGEFDGLVVKDPYFFRRQIVQTKGDLQVIDSDLSPHVKDLQDYIAINIINEPIFIRKIRLQCYVPVFSDNSITHVHSDLGFSYKKNAPDYSIMYYVNDSSGDTIFFNDDKKVIKRVSPKKGTGVVFNPTILHSGQCPQTHVPRFSLYMHFCRQIFGPNFDREKYYNGKYII